MSKRQTARLGHHDPSNSVTAVQRRGSDSRRGTSSIPGPALGSYLGGAFPSPSADFSILKPKVHSSVCKILSSCAASSQSACVCTVFCAPRRGSRKTDKETKAQMEFPLWHRVKDPALSLQQLGSLLRHQFDPWPSAVG